MSEGGFLGDLELPVPQPGGLAVGIAGFVYDRRCALVISKEDLDRSHLVLIRI